MKRVYGAKGNFGHDRRKDRIEWRAWWGTLSRRGRASAAYRQLKRGQGAREAVGTRRAES